MRFVVSSEVHIIGNDNWSCSLHFGSAGEATNQGSRTETMLAVIK